MSIILHALLLSALEIQAQLPRRTDQHRIQIEARTEGFEFLVVLPMQFPWAYGERETDAKDNCSRSRSMRSPPEIMVYFDIPAGPLEHALETFSKQTSLPWAVSSQYLINERASRVKGWIRPADAADRLLAGTGLCADWIEGSLSPRPCAELRGEGPNPSFGPSERDNPCASERPMAEPDELLPPMSYI